MKTSFHPDEIADYQVEFKGRLDGIEIHIRDIGLPYDPSLIQGYDPAANILEQDMEGLGSFLIKQTMGEYRFNNLGVRGKEVAPEIVVLPPDPQQQQVFAFVIAVFHAFAERLQHGDADFVVFLFQRIYGCSCCRTLHQQRVFFFRVRKLQEYVCEIGL